MPCSHSQVLRRLVVQDATTLETEPWKTHVARCAECQAERMAFDRSLAVFTQLESERRSEVSGPSWDRFAATLERSRRARHQRRLRAVLSTAAAALLVLTSGVVYQSVEGTSPSPAKIVRLHPDQQHHLFRALQSSLQGDRWVPYAMNEPVSMETRAPGSAPLRFTSGTGKAAVSFPVGLPRLRFDSGPPVMPNGRVVSDVSTSFPRSVPVMGATLGREANANPPVHAAPGVSAGAGSSTAFPLPIR